MGIFRQMALAAAAGVCAATAAAPEIARAQQTFPSKAIRLVVPFSAGGTPDIIARLIGPKMGENLGQPVVIENRPGASGTIGAAMVAKATPDGHTLLLTTSAFSISAALQPSLPYDPVNDFAGVSNIGFSTMVLVVAPGLGLKSVKELIALAQTRPGKVFYGSAGAGSATHMHAERFKLATGISAGHVGFKGQPEFLVEVAAGRVHFGVAALTVCLPLVKEGRLQALALSDRVPQLPEVPTMAEMVPGWGRDGSTSLRAPAGTPVHVLKQIGREVARILELAEVKDRLHAVGYHITPSTPEESDKSLRADIEAFSRVVRAAGLRTQ